MGCFVDVGWYDLNVRPERGKGHSYSRMPLLLWGTAIFDMVSAPLSSTKKSGVQIKRTLWAPPHTFSGKGKGGRGEGGAPAVLFI